MRGVIQAGNADMVDIGMVKVRGVRGSVLREEGDGAGNDVRDLPVLMEGSAGARRDARSRVPAPAGEYEAGEGTTAVTAGQGRSRRVRIEVIGDCGSVLLTTLRVLCDELPSSYEDELHQL
jgi:hypothetical protein